MAEVLISDLNITTSPSTNWVIEIEGNSDNYQLSWGNLCIGVKVYLASLTGVDRLSADAIKEGTTNLFLTQDERDKLASIPEGGGGGLGEESLFWNGLI
jgi:hypothetical protein